MKKFLACSLALISFFLLTAMGSGPGKDEQFASIVSVNIADKEVLSGSKPFMVTFSEEMVAKDAVDKEVPADKMPMSISPAVPGTGRWVSQTSFVFSPDKGFPPGREFRAVLSKELRSLAGKEVWFVFSFRTAVTNVRYLGLDSYNAQARTLTLGIELSQPVKSEALASHITIKNKATGEAMPFVLSDKSESTRHSIKMASVPSDAQLAVSIRTDTDNDPTFLGLEMNYGATVTLPKSGGGSPGAEVVQQTTGGKSDLTIDYQYTSQYDGNISARFYLNRPLAEQPLEKKIVVTPDVPFELNESRNTLVFSQDLEPGMDLTVTLMPGLMDENGNTLSEKISRSLLIEDYDPRAAFCEPGNFITSSFGGRVPVELVNVDKVIVSLYRQYDNNLPFVDISSSYDDELSYLARSIKVQEVKLSLQRNEKQRRSIDVEALAGGQRGVFKLKVDYYSEYESDGQTYMSWQGSNERWVVISDIGLTGRVYPSGIAAYAVSLSTGKPMPGVDLKIHSRSNQVIAQGRTNAQGYIEISRDTPWESQLEPYMMTATSGTDLTLLPLGNQAGVNLGPDGGVRPYLDKGYEAFLFTPRGVFRPGETVNIKAFVRDAARNAPAPFPVLFVVESSRGLEAGRGTATLSDQGGADFTLNLPATASTGSYFAKLVVPGKESEPLGTVNFSVEDFVPPRLEVEVSPKQESFTGGDALPVELSAMYLFGAPGDSLLYELGYRAKAKLFAPAGWEGYAFNDSQVNFDTESNLRYMTGNLSAKGDSAIAFKAPAGWKIPSMLEILLIAGVQEDGGRWVTKSTSVDYYPNPYFIGIKPPAQDSQAPGKEIALKVATVAADGKAWTKAQSLKFDVFSIRGTWATTVRDGRYVYTWNERLTPVHNGDLKLAGGQGDISFTPKQFGHYLVRCSADDGKIISSVRLGVYGSSGEGSEDGSGRLDKVELSLDKKAYLAGETAKLTVKAPFKGTLYIGAEKAARLFTRVIEMQDASVVVDIPVTAVMDPNITLTAWVFRPVEAENKEWFAHRAAGAIPLCIEKKPFTLNVAATTPERASPSKPLSIPFSVVDGNGRPVAGEFSVALVDEGILSLTSFATPDPVAYFMAQRIARGASFDIYDRLMRPELKATTLLIPGGDGAGDAYLGSLSTQQVFLTAFIPTVTTGADGKAVAEFDIPEYSGKGRLMIVGASKNLFASAASPVRFARDVVVEPSAPRAVAPGDTFEVFVKAFTMDNEQLKGAASITVSAAGPVELSGAAKNEIALGKKDSRNFSVTGKALGESGIATLTVKVEVPGNPDLSFEKSFEMVVRPPYPRTSFVVSEMVAAGQNKQLAIKGSWLKGTTSSSLSVDNSPIMAILPALEFLREYPYGCLEQTTSRTWPYLTLTSIMKAIAPDKADEKAINSTLADAVARISSMQTPDGGFAMWPGGTTPAQWASINATHILVEARSKVPVSKRTMDAALGYMRYILSASEGYFGGDILSNTYKAYAAFVLTRAGEPPLSWLQVLSENESRMLPSGRIFLAAAKALQAGNSKPLQNLGKIDLTTIDEDYRYGYSLEGTLRNMSLQLMAWSLVDPSDPAAATLAKDVAKHLGKMRYFTTQDAGMATLAIGLYVEKTDSVGRDFTAEVSAAGKPIGQATNKQPLLLAGGSMPVDLNGQPLPISVKVDGKGTAYCVYSVRGVPSAAPAAEASDMTLTRVWKTSSGQVLDPQGVVNLNKGDRVTVEIVVAPKFSLNDVVLSDLTPGGMEVENPRLNTQSGADGGNQQPGHLELREDRVLVFFDRLSGPVTYSYTMRAVSKGTFALPQVSAEGMYNPEIRATSAPGQLVIK